MKANGHRFRKRRSKRPPRAGNELAYRQAIRQLPCCVSGRRPVEGHHLKQSRGNSHTEGPRSERGMGRRASDRWLVPLAPDLHHELEQLPSTQEIAWFRQRGVDSVGLAESLWQTWCESRNVEQLTTCLLRWRAAGYLVAGGKLPI